MKNFTKIAAVILMATASVAFAANTSTSFSVTATVDSQGVINVTSAPVIAVGNPATTPQAAATGTFTVGTNTTVQPSIYFTPASSITTPTMTSPSTSATLAYNLYLPTGGAVGNYGAPSAACPAVGTGTALTYGAANTYNVLATGAQNGTFNICVQARGIPPTQQAAGDYTDNVILGLNY